MEEGSDHDVRFWSKSQGEALRKGKEDVSGSERSVTAVGWIPVGINNLV